MKRYDQTSCTFNVGWGRVFPALAFLVFLPNSLLSGSQLQSMTFSEHLILDRFRYAFGIAIGDIDQDGDMDITAADADRQSFHWFENIGNGNFKRRYVLRAVPRPRLERHAIGDINGDGWPDIVVVENLMGGIYWLENNGTPSDGRFWKLHEITSRGLAFAYDVSLADINGNGLLDVAASGWEGNEIAWFENPGGSKSVWVKHLLDSDLIEARTIRAADFDGDGRPDFLATGRKSNMIVWYQHPGDDVAGAWRKHIIDDSSEQPVHGHPVDMDNDGDLDVVMAFGMASGDGFVGWYENDGDPSKGPWKKHIIDQPLEDAFEVVAADLDGDKVAEVVATTWGKNGGLYVFASEGNVRGPWEKRQLKSQWNRAVQVILGDLDNDGLPDIVAEAERGSNELRWWKNGPWSTSVREPFIMTKKGVIQNIKFPKNTLLSFYPSGELFSAVLGRNAKIKRNKLLKGTYVEFSLSGTIDTLRLPADGKINGINCAHSEWISFFDSGALKSCVLSRAQRILGRKYEKGEFLVITDDGRPLTLQEAESEKNRNGQ